MAEMDYPFDVCPACASREPWAGAVFRAYRWQGRGGDVTDVIPCPTPALIEAILVLDGERNECEAEEFERIRSKGAA